MKKEELVRNDLKTENTQSRIHVVTENIERFMETRESYIHALESTVQLLKTKLDFHEKYLSCFFLKALISEMLMRISFSESKPRTMMAKSRVDIFL